MKSKRQKKAKPEPPVGPSADEQAKYQAEEDLRTLTRAMEIKEDPRRAEHVRKLAKEQAAAMMKLYKHEKD